MAKTNQTTKNQTLPARQTSSAFPRKIVPLVLAVLLLLLTSCQKQTEQTEQTDQTAAGVLGEINYQADVVWIEPSKSGDTDMLDYREILDLDKFVINSELPVVLCVKKSIDGDINKVIPWMEDQAYKNRGKINFVLVEDDPKNEFLYYLKYQTTPTIFLINQGEVLTSAAWHEEQAFLNLEKKIAEFS